VSINLDDTSGIDKEQVIKLEPNEEQHLKQELKTEEKIYLNIGSLNILSDELSVNPLVFVDGWIVSTLNSCKNQDFSQDAMRVMSLLLLSDILISPEENTEI